MTSDSMKVDKPIKPLRLRDVLPPEFFDELKYWLSVWMNLEMFVLGAVMAISANLLDSHSSRDYQ